MKEGLLELVFILDRSGSMSGLEEDTIGGYNSILEKHKKEGTNCTLTTVLFDDMYELLHNRVPIEKVKKLTAKKYFVRGTTALLDAIGKTINSIGEALHKTEEPERPSSVLFVIITDGLENASREFSHKKVREMIEHQQTKYSWEFLFIGANIDAITEAEMIGISAKNAVNYVPDKEGTRILYKTIGQVSYCKSCMLHQEELPETWKKDIEADHQKRGRKKK